jgi:hypothetical protein
MDRLHVLDCLDVTIQVGPFAKCPVAQRVLALEWPLFKDDALNTFEYRERQCTEYRE